MSYPNIEFGLIILSTSQISLDGRLSSANTSSATALGRNSHLISNMSKLVIVVPRQGMAPKVWTLESRRSVNIFSSASEAMLLRGPTRTQTRPR